MSLTKQKSLEAIRTFARDVEREQDNSEEAKQALSSLPKTEVTKPPAPKEDEKKKSAITNIKAEPKESKKEEQESKKKETIVATKPIGGGTIITDTKKTKRSFFSELQTSISNWFKKTKKSFQPKEKNTYEVSTTERRKGVVQKATSKTGTMFSADNETLREQIKARQRAEKREHDDLNWSPYTETGYPLLEGDEVESVDPRITKVAVKQKTHVAPKPVIRSTEKIPELQEKVEEPIPKFVPEPEPEPEPITVPAPVEEPREEKEIEETLPEPSDEDSVSEEADSEEKSWELDEVSLQDTNTLAMLLVGIALAIGIFGFVIFGIFGVGRNNPVVEIPQPVEAVYVDAVLKEITVSNHSFNELVSKTNSTLVTNEDSVTTEYQFTNTREQHLPSGLLMNMIRNTDDDGFADNVSLVRFISTGSGKRSLLLTTPDETITRGGMLNWEDTLYADVGALLDIQNIAPPSAGTFIDTQIGSLDIRSLVFSGNTLLVYAIINKTDVIIANDVSVLTPYSQ